MAELLERDGAARDGREKTEFHYQGDAQFATFYLGDRLFGIDVEHVQEVMKFQEKSRIPLAPAYLAGLINLRGQIVTLLDLRVLLGLAPPAEEGTSMNVVVNSPEGPVSLMVDEIGDVLDVSEILFEQPPPTMSGKMMEYVQGIYKLDEQLLITLNVNRLLEH